MQERSSDPTQPRPNPPTFAQGVISESLERLRGELLICFSLLGSFKRLCIAFLRVVPQGLHFCLSDLLHTHSHTRLLQIAQSGIIATSLFETNLLMQVRPEFAEREAIEGISYPFNILSHVNYKRKATGQLTSLKMGVRAAAKTHVVVKPDNTAFLGHLGCCGFACLARMSCNTVELPVFCESIPTKRFRQGQQIGGKCAAVHSPVLSPLIPIHVCLLTRDDPGRLTPTKKRVASTADPQPRLDGTRAINIMA